MRRSFSAVAAMVTALTVALAGPVAAQEKRFRLAVPAALADSGLLGYMLPRFSLKTGTRITLVAPEAEAEAWLARDGGVPAFKGPEGIWWLSVTGDVHAQRFADWLGSEVGRRAVDGFEVAGKAPFTSSVAQEVVTAEVAFDGDALQGEALSLRHCGRCHVVGEKNRMNAIGSTPSFAVLRTLADWDQRFQTFYVLNPHPAFTQIEGVSLPFDPSLPSPIVPMEMTVEDLEAILAFVASIPPADLGAPIVSR